MPFEREIAAYLKHWQDEPERAAIIEFDADVPRAEGERAAMEIRPAAAPRRHRLAEAPAPEARWAA